MNPTVGTQRFLEALRRVPVIGIIRAGDAGSAAGYLDDLITVGLTAVEVSLSTPGALDVIAEAMGGPRVAVADGHYVHIGVGTVFTADQLHASVDAGARFVVTPTTDVDVLAAAARRDVAIVPGAATPTEVQRAMAGGAAAVKLFPASLWSIAAFRDLRTVFPEVPFVPTGGVSERDASAWLRAGAVAVGMGSALTSGSVEVASFLQALASDTP